MKNLPIQNQNGFSLIEAMIAMVILSVGLMSVGLMQIGAMKGNANAIGRSDGVAMAQSAMDLIRCLPLNSSLLSDPDPSIVNLDDGKAIKNAMPNPPASSHKSNDKDADGNQIFTSDPVIGPNDKRYTIFWNIDDNTPTNGVKTIRLFVYWTDNKFGLNRFVTTSVLGGLYL